MEIDPQADGKLRPMPIFDRSPAVLFLFPRSHPAALMLVYLLFGGLVFFF
jgi:hypothetical protein